MTMKFKWIKLKKNVELICFAYITAMKSNLDLCHSISMCMHPGTFVLENINIVSIDFLKVLLLLNHK